MATINRYSLHLQEFVIEMRIGIHDFERGVTQRVAIDVDVDLAGPYAFSADTIKGVVDYDFLRREIRALAASKHFDTQEAFCEAILSVALAGRGVERASVWTRKLDVYPDCRSVGVRLSGTP
jgi:dihydroneopterin aldolase